MKPRIESIQPLLIFWTVRIEKCFCSFSLGFDHQSCCSKRNNRWGNCQSDVCGRAARAGRDDLHVVRMGRPIRGCVMHIFPVHPPGIGSIRWFGGFTLTNTIKHHRHSNYEKLTGETNEAERQSHEIDE